MARAGAILFSDGSHDVTGLKAIDSMCRSLLPRLVLAPRPPFVEKLRWVVTIDLVYHLPSSQPDRV